MISGKTRTGFEYVIDDNVFDDYEILELMAKVKKNDPLAIFELIERLLGEEQKDQLKDHVRVNGRVSMSAINDEIVDIFSNEEVKKS